MGRRNAIIPAPPQPPPAPPARRVPVSVSLAALGCCIAVALPFGFGHVIDALSRHPPGAEAHLTLGNGRNCSWYRPYECIELRAGTTLKAGTQAKVEKEGDSRRACAGVLCGMLFERHRGADDFLDFAEAARFDDDARKRVRAQAPSCMWPGALGEGDACWADVSAHGTKEMVAEDACRFLRCRAGLGYASAMCARAVCGA